MGADRPEVAPFFIRKSQLAPFFVVIWPPNLSSSDTFKKSLAPILMRNWLPISLTNTHGDIAFFTQPASPSSRFGRQRKKIYDKYDRGIKLQVEADELRKNSEWLERRGAVVKGDAERKRQAKREELDKVISIGSKVYDYLFGEGEVIRVNKKTYTIHFASGGIYAREKVYVKPIE